jgi:hypothetical protein
LSVFGAGAHQFIEVRHPHPPVVDAKPGDTAARFDVDANRAIAESRFGIALEEVERLDKVTVSVDRSHVAHAPW